MDLGLSQAPWCEKTPFMLDNVNIGLITHLSKKLRKSEFGFFILASMITPPFGKICFTFSKHLKNANQRNSGHLFGSSGVKPSWIRRPNGKVTTRCDFVGGKWLKTMNQLKSECHRYVGAKQKTPPRIRCKLQILQNEVSWVLKIDTCIIQVQRWIKNPSPAQTWCKRKVVFLNMMPQRVRVFWVFWWVFGSYK